MRSIKVTGVLSLLALAGAAASANAAATFDQVNLGSGGAYCMFNMGPTKFEATGSGSLWNTNLALGPGASTAFKNGGTLNGTLYKDPSATVQAAIVANPAGNSTWHVLGGIVTTSTNGAKNDVTNAYNLAKMLLPDQTTSSIKNNFTINNSGGSPNGFGGTNKVVYVKGEINLDKKILTIQGGANDWFIINVLKNIKAKNGAKIQLSGGIPASHVLFTVGYKEWRFEGKTTSVAGTYLAPKPGQSGHLHAATMVGGAYGYKLHMPDNSKFTGECYVAVPVPGTAALLGLGGLVAARRRRVA